MTSTPAPEGTILVGTDGSERAQCAVDWAAREAEMRGSRLTILTAWTPERAPDVALWAFGYAGSRLLEDIHADQVLAATALVDRAARAVRRRYPDLDVRTIAHQGDAREALSEYGKDASLIVVGSRGAGPIASIALGSVAFWLTRHAPVALAVVPTDAERSSAGMPRSGVVVGVSFDPLSAKIVDAAAQEAEERCCDLLLAYCAWDGDASRHRWEGASEAEFDSLGVEITHRLADSVRTNYPHLKVRCRFARGAADRFLADVSRTHEVLVLGRRHSSPLDLIDVGTMATSIFRHAPFVVMVVPLTTEDDDELAAAGGAFRPARSR